MNKIFKSLKEKCTKENKLILLFIILFFIFVFINLIINRINIKNNEQITEDLYAITENSKENISKISDEQEINIYLFGYSENDFIWVFAKKYEELNKKIKVELKNISENEELINEYHIEEGDILITSGEKYKLYKDSDLYSYDYNNGDIINLTEQRLTNGICEISSAQEKEVIYILKGNEKYLVENELSLLKRYLELEKYEIKEITLSSDDMPEELKTLIISSPNNDFSDEETNKIKEYINNGGNILWLQDAYFEEKEFNNINSILEIYGLEKFNSGIILEQEKNNIIIQNPYLILPEKNESENNMLNMPSKVMFYYSSKINFANDEKLNELNVTKTELLSTSEKALYKTDLSSDTMTKRENDEEGKFIVGALLNKKIDEEKNSKIIIFANNYFVTNEKVTIGKEEIPVVELYNNKELILNSLDYLTNNENDLKIQKLMPRNYYIGIEEDNIRQAIIIEMVIFVLLIRNGNIYKKNK